MDVKAGQGLKFGGCFGCSSPECIDEIQKLWYTREIDMLSETVSM